jgi:predicted transposase YbfD/YdcC
MVDEVTPKCLLSKTDGDTMYWDQAIRQHDLEELIKGAVLEVTTHEENGH